MSVDHYLLPITAAELAGLVARPGTVRAFVEARRWDRVVCLHADGRAISALTAADGDDPVAFLFGEAKFIDRWIGDESDGDAVVGYQRVAVYAPPFVADLAGRLHLWTVEAFEEHCDVAWLAEHDIYPGDWLDPWRRPALVKSFTNYRACVTAAAAAGEHLLVWLQ